MGARARLFTFLAGAAAVLAAGSAGAQFSDSYNFLKAVRDADGAKVEELINRPGMIDTRDGTTGESALHIVVRRHDQTYLAYLLAKGADANARDRRGETPLLVAARQSDPEATRLLLVGGARPNVSNGAGETPLIIATQQRDAATVRLLLTNGADPKLADRVAGKSARDYAANDRRSTAILRLLDEAKPAAPAKGVTGPVLPR